MQMSWAEFREQVSLSLDREELRTLCFDLDIDYDALRGEGKDDKVRELITLLRRNGRFPELITRLEKIRPNIDWQAIVTQIPNSSSEQAKHYLPNNILAKGVIILLIILPLIWLFMSLTGLFDNASQDNNQTGVNEETTSTGGEVTQANSNSCLNDYFAEIAPERQGSIELGERSRDITVVNEDRSSAEFSEPYGYKLTQNGEMIGALILIFRSQDVLFKILSVADENCEVVGGYRNVTRRSEDTLEDSDVLEMPLNEGVYTIRPNFQGTHIRFSFQEVVSP